MVQKLRKVKPQQRQEQQEKSKISKFIKKKSKNAALTKRDNTYVFEGFYEKLKQIDVKQSNALETNFMYDSVLRQTQDNEEDGLFNSNFIQLLRSERANNKTIEFGRVYKVLEPFCFSYPLLVLNKSQVVTLMLYFLNPESARTILNESEQTQSVKKELLNSVLNNGQPLFAIQVVILDLMVALIKDFRQDIYQDFVGKILPAVISVIDMQKVQILDKVFIVISFGIKYLSKSIKEDISNFYSSYSELLIHKNRYLRKFAAQSLSYVLRKLTFDQKVIAMIINLVNNKDSEDTLMAEENKLISIQQIINNKELMNKILGTSDMLFEVVYGAGEGLHSKFNEVMSSLISYYQDQIANKQLAYTLEVLLRCLILKLANEVDTEKQQPIFDLIDNSFDHQDNEVQLNLVLDMFKDMIRLKYGKRLSNYGIITMIAIFNKLLGKNLQNVSTFSLATKISIVKTLSTLYYFKHNNVKQILAKSNIDINDFKNLFTSSAFKLIDTSQTQSIHVYEAYLDLLLRKPHEIQSFEDLDWSLVLGLKQSSKNLMEFSQDSHQSKIQVLIRAVNKFTLSQISNESCSTQLKIDLMAVFIGLQGQVPQKFEIELGEKVENSVLKIVKQLQSEKDKLEQQFVLFRYLSFSKTNSKFMASISQGIQKDVSNISQESPASLKQNALENAILQKYKLSHERFEDLDRTLNMIIDSQNIGDLSHLSNQIRALKLSCIINCNKDYIQTIIQEVKSNSQDIVHLRAINSVRNLTFELQKHNDLFNAIQFNLLKNQQQLRTESLLLLTKFDKLKYLDKPFQVTEKQQENEIEKSEVYNGSCPIIDLMLQFEETKISFETEKTKILLIKKIEAQLNTGLIPLEYVQVAFKFLIGCFWIKFTPIFEAVQEALNSIIFTYGLRKSSQGKQSSGRDFTSQILRIVRDLGLILQITHENQDIENIIKKKLSSVDNDSMILKCYLREAILDEDYLEVKDFYFNLTKTLHSSVDLLLENQQDSQFLFDSFYEYIDQEYSEASANKVEKSNSSNLVDRMTLANMIDSEEYRKFRKITYSKLYCYIELFHSAEQLQKLPRLQDFQTLMLKLTSSSDTKLQKLALDCLIKTDYKGGILKHYRKLLDGLADDEKFKDTISAVTFGSSKQQAENSNYPAEGDQQKKQDKSAIPKLQDIHRLDVLPVIIKLLLSKLARKKGSINKKSIHVRRNIVFNFMSSLKNKEELDMFVTELLVCFDLKLNETLNEEVLLTKLSSVSFNVFINFVNQLSVVIKHIGNALSDHLVQISKVLVAIMSLTKQFATSVKESLVTSNIKDLEDQEMSEEEQSEIEEEDKVSQQGNQKDTLYKFVGKQSKMCLRKSLSVVMQIYQKFNHLSSFVKILSADFFKKIAEDQLNLLQTNYLSDKSQLIEILTTQWSANLMTLQNFMSYPQVLPYLLGMLSQPKISSEVYELHFQMLKTLLQKSIAGEEAKKDIFAISKAKKRQAKDQPNEEGEDQVMEQIDNELITKERELTKQIINSNIQHIASNLNVFAQNNLNQMKNTLYQKKHYNTRHIQNNQNQKTPDYKQNTLKDFIFIISEVVAYLKPEDQINSEFLDMCVSILSLKQLHSEHSSSSGSTSFTEDLLLYGCKSVCQLLTKCRSVTQEQIEKILIMFLTLRSLKVRNVLSRGLLENVFSENSKFGQSLGISRQCIQIIFNLNKVKKGLADVELDYDSIIKTIESLDDKSFENLSHFEIRAISYSIVFLLQSEEFAVRDFSNHYFQKLLCYLSQLIQRDVSLFQKEYGCFLQSYEGQLLYYVKFIHDELVLKTILETLRNLVIFLSDHREQVKSNQNIHSLIALVGKEQDQQDFFTKFLAIKLKSRAKSMQFLIQKLDEKQVTDYKAIQAVVLPLLNYVIFGSKQQRENRRNTVTYSREERRMTVDEALKAYQAIAKQLKWTDYYRMLKQLVFKLNKITNKAGLFALSGISSKSEDSHHQKERIIIKCICKVLNGFNFSEVNDAVTDLQKSQIDMDDAGQDQDFENLLLNLKQNQILSVQANDELSENESEGDQDELQEKSVKMSQQHQEQKVLEQDIQSKLYHRVLPILERHLTDYEEQEGQDKEKNGEAGMNHGYGSIRSFVVLSITRLIRKLPREQFEIQLGKLINNIISKGLRSRLLVHREKARKGLLKLLVEVSPRYLSLVFTLMNDLLTRGYQLQTYIFSILYLLQQLQEKKILETGMITHKVLEITGEKVMDELFGELNTEQKNAGIEDQQKNKIKEAKGKKAVPIFELYSQYIDFKKNFFTLLGPILRSLDGNPSIGKIQQCEELLNRISGSIIKNQSVKGDQLLIFMYSIIDKGVGMAARIKINEYDGAKVKRDYGAKVIKEDMFIKTKEQYKEQTYKVDMKWAKGNSLIDQKKAEELSGRVMATFGLMCLKKALKNKGLILSNQNEIIKKNQSGISIQEDGINYLDEDLNTQIKKGSEEVKEELKAKLDPFVNVLLNAFKTYHNPIVVSTLHVLGMIINLGLPSFKQLMKKFLNRLFKLFEQTSTSTANQDLDFINSLFKCTAELIKTYSTYQDLSPQQLKTLLFVIKTSLNSSGGNNPHMINVFHLLRALVFRKFLSADLYDIIDKNVQDLMITSLSSSIRSLCSSIFVNFLLEYPLEESRLSQHFNHLLKHLGTYFDSEGRHQILEILERLCQKMPQQILDNESEKWAFTLMTRLVNEKNRRCKDKVKSVLTKLFQKISQPKTKAIYNTLLEMKISAEQSEIKRQAITQARLQIVGVIIETQSGLIKSKNEVNYLFSSLLWPQIEHSYEQIKQELDSKILKKLKKGSGQQSEDEEEDIASANPEFKKFLQRIELIESNQEGKGFLMQDYESEDKDSWSSLYFALENIHKMLIKQEIGKVTIEIFKKTPQGLRMLLLINSNHHIYWIKLSVQRIVRAILDYLNNNSKESILSVFNLGSESEALKQSLSYINSFKNLPMTQDLKGEIVYNSRLMTQSLLELVKEEDSQKGAVQMLFSRLSLIGRKVMLNIKYSQERLDCILSFFKLSLSLFESLLKSKDNYLTREVCDPIMQLVYRVYTDEQYQANTAPKTLSFEIVDYFSQHLDKGFFLRLYNQVKQSILDKRLERKRQHKVMQVSNAAEWEKIKTVKRDKKRDKKKEKKRQEKIRLAFTKT